MKSFKLQGSSSENFKKLEQIMPRIIKRLGTKTYGIIPASVLSAFTKSPNEDGMLISGCLFKGRIKKVAFRIQKILGKETPGYSCVFYRGLETSSFAINTKKKNYVQQIDVPVSDGDYFEIFQTNSEEVQLENINIAILMELEQKDAKICSNLTKQLLNETDISDEGI